MIKSGLVHIIYGVCKKFKELINPKGEIALNSAFVIDDTIDSRVGAKIENVSYVHDHTGKAGTKLGFKNLFLGLFDGISFIPLDFSIHSEKALPRKKRKQQFKKECAAKSNGATRRKECKTKKNINAIILLKREIKNGVIHVICGIRKDKRNYLYDGCIKWTPSNSSFLAYYRRINAYETLGNLFSVIKDELCEKKLAQRLWELFDELLQIVIEAIAESGTVDIKGFRQSPEYQYLQGLFEKSFLSNQLFGVNNAA